MNSIKAASIIILLALCACAEVEIIELPTATVAATATATSTTPTATATLVPMKRAIWDFNTFPVGSAEWMAWNHYDAELRRLDAIAKARGEVGLTAAEQMRIWMDALRQFGVIE